MTNYHYDLLEWEITTACNAACPQCPRNYYGGKTWKNLPIIQNSLSWAQTHFTEKFIKKLKRIDFCGTYGDPILNNEFLEIVRWVRTVNNELHLSVKTNGGLKNTDWWAELSHALGPNSCVFFGIDGLEDTNHLYRRKVDFQKVIQNAQSFINAGGNAFWNFIVFKHNQHQVDDARLLSQQLGFKNFQVKCTSRFFDKTHQLQESFAVLDNDGKVEYYLEIPTDHVYVNNSYKKIEFIRKSSDSLDRVLSESDISCKCMKWSRIYLSAEGYVFPCGWLHDRMYGVEAERHSDAVKLKKMFDLAGGSEFANINYTPIEKIVNGAWFTTLINSWSNSSRLNRCEVMCGEQLNLIGDQNKMIKKF